LITNRAKFATQGAREADLQIRRFLFFSMNKEQIEKIIADVSYKDWTFAVVEKGEHLFVQAAWMEKDSYSEHSAVQASRKWYLSPFMTVSEIVQTVFLLVKTAEEHEMREGFKYKDQRIFNPHFSADALADLCRSKAFDYRK
jgi:hypothetical protein